MADQSGWTLCIAQAELYMVGRCDREAGHRVSWPVQKQRLLSWQHAKDVLGTRKASLSLSKDSHNP